MMPSQLHTQLGHQLVADYLAGRNGYEVGSRYGVDSSTVYDWVRRAGFSVRSSPAARRKHPLNALAFESDTDDAAYWFGFVLADGCVYVGNGKTYSIPLSLAEPDREHVERFQQFMETTTPVKIIKRSPSSKGLGGGPLARIHITSKPLTESLIRLGMSPRKSLTAIVPEKFRDNRHFWRGLVDGDGFVFWSHRDDNRYPIIGLCGSQDCCQQFTKFVSRSIPHITEKKSHKQANLHHVRFHGTDAADVAHLLYHDAATTLARKKTVANEFMDHHANTQRRTWRHLTGNELSKLKKQHGTWAKVAASLGVYPTTVTKLRKKLGLAVTRPITHPHITRPELESLHATHQSWAAVGRELGIQDSALFGIRKRLGVRTQDRQGRPHKFPTLTRAALEDLYKQHGTWPSVAVAIGTTGPSLVKIRRRLSMPIRASRTGSKRAIEIPQTELVDLRRKLGSWVAVANHLDILEGTLIKIRRKSGLAIGKPGRPRLDASAADY